MYDDETIARFWARVDQSGGPNTCWVWKAGKDGAGYGAFIAGGKQFKSHRFAYMTEHGPLTPDVYVCHRCDNPPCCNPAHLFAGTAGDNNRDTVAKGRHNPWPGVRAGQHLGAVAGGKATGRENGKVMRKLSAEQVHELRARHAGGEGYDTLARCFGVSKDTVRGIVKGKRYADV